MSTQTPGGVRIKTLNVQKRRTVVDSLLNDPASARFDVLCLQELPIGLGWRVAESHRDHWTAIFPSMHDRRSPDQSVRSAILIRTHIPSSTYTQITINSLDITAVAFRTPHFSFSLFSIYNPCYSDDSITALHFFLNSDPSIPPNLIFIGDFNKHHPLWSGTLTLHRRASDAETLLSLMSAYGLQLGLPPGVATHRSGSTLDLAMVTADLAEAVVSCDASFGHGSDHQAVDLCLDLESAQVASDSRLNWRDVDWDELCKELAESIAAAGELADSAEWATTDALDDAFDLLLAIISEVVRRCVPKAKPSPFSKRWWTRELTAMRHNLECLLRRARKRRATEKEKDESRVYSTAYSRAIRHAKLDHWREWLEDATEQTIWVANRYAARAESGGVSTRIPTLVDDRRIAETTEEKTAMLRKIFFPPQPDVDLNDIARFEYPTPLPDEPVSQDEVNAFIQKLSPLRAPGPTQTRNIFFKKCALILNPLWRRFVQRSFDLRYHPRAAKRYATCVLRKPGKDDYSKPGAWRPIALQNGEGKPGEGVAAARLIGHAERCGLLPPLQFGARPGRSTTDAALTLVQYIYDVWRQKGVATVLYLDIKQAFPTVCHARLIHNMRKRRVPEELVGFVASFLRDRKTQLRLGDQESAWFAADYGIPQGSPLSPVLYLFYAADLLEIVEPTARNIFARQLVTGFVDDTAIVVASKEGAEHNVQTLRPIVQLAFGWSATHACKFDAAKFHMVHHTRNRDRNLSAELVLGDVTIRPEQQARYLGVILDKELRWHAHVDSVVAKSTAAVLAIGRLASGRFGLPHRFIRNLFISVVRPKMEYGAVLWYTPVQKVADSTRRRGTTGFADRLSRVQRIAARLVTGAFKTAPTDALEYHADLMPMDLQLNTAVYGAALRLASLPEHHPLYKQVHKCLAGAPLQFKSPLHHLFRAFPGLQNVEVVDSTPRSLARTSPLTTHIADSREDAAAAVARLEESDTITFYTDGSGEGDQVGAAAVTGYGGVCRVERALLGALTRHTVFEGELFGVLLALRMVLTLPKVLDVAICLDNQSAIVRAHSPRAKSGQLITAAIHDALETIRKDRPGFTLQLVWVPGHDDVEGNELADLHAKQASSGVDTACAELNGEALPDSVAALRATFKKATRREWQRRWVESERGRRYASTLR